MVVRVGQNRRVNGSLLERKPLRSLVIEGQPGIGPLTA